MYNIFDESPSQIVDYEQLISTVSSNYSLQFCSRRWIENEQIAKRAREILEKIKGIINVNSQLIQVMNISLQYTKIL